MMETMQAGLGILVAEEEPGARNLIRLALKRQGYVAEIAEDMKEAISKLREGRRYAALLVDLETHGNLSALVEEARYTQPPTPVIGIAAESAPSTTEALLDDVITKPIVGGILRKTIDQCVRKQQVAYGSDDASSGVRELGAPSSVWRNEIQPLIRHVAVADVPVLVRGETGVGKEVLARQIHSLSPRAKKPFLKVNCAALPSELIESELFGYERGAFTGAFKTTQGKFEMAEGGTILLDEIGDMDFKLQAKLLQVLQDNEFIRLGSSEPRRVNVRVMAATHCDLEKAITENRFREDLYYRLNIISFNVPSLRERRDEILPLTYHFMRKHGTPMQGPVEISPVLREALLAHDWPGNIRELENVVRKLLVLRRPEIVARELQTNTRRRTSWAAPTVEPSPEISSIPAITKAVHEMPAMPVPVAIDSYATNGNIHDDLRETARVEYYAGGLETVTRDSGGGKWPILERVDQARREAETEAILNALRSTLWNRKRAAALLHIDYKALLYKMKKLGIVERAAKVAI